MFLVIRDPDKVQNDDVCLPLFEIMQMHQAHSPDCATTTVSDFVSIVIFVNIKVFILFVLHLLPCLCLLIL